MEECKHKKTIRGEDEKKLIINRLSRIERQIKKLEQRISRLENPSGYNQYNEPDNSMYMM